MNRFVDHYIRDRRLVPRYNFRTLLRFHIWKSDIPEQTAETENLSERGIFFSTHSPISLNTPLELSFKMPQEVSGQCAADWRCLGHVVRLVHGFASRSQCGVGVQFDFYEVAPPS